MRQTFIKNFAFKITIKFGRVWDGRDENHHIFTFLPKKISAGYTHKDDNDEMGMIRFLFMMRWSVL